MSDAVMAELVAALLRALQQLHIFSQSSLFLGNPIILGPVKLDK